MRAIRLERFGGPEVLEWKSIEAPTPKEDELLVEVGAAGVNRADILLRIGAFHGASPPATPGREGAGTVLAVGAKVTRFRPGDRVLALQGRPGFYAERACAPERLAVRVPDGVSTTDAGALGTAWITAYACLHHVTRARAGETCLVTAGASGVGQAAIQLAVQHGLRVLAVAGSEEKLAYCRALGAEAALDYGRDRWWEAVREATGGRGVDVVLEAVGGRIFAGALKTLAPFARVASFANVTLEDSVVNTRDFYPKNAVIEGFALPFRIESGRYDPRPDMTTILEGVAAGRLRAGVERTFPMAEAAAAQRYLEERRNKGKVVLVP